jgi:hypothetical protein
MQGCKHFAPCLFLGEVEIDDELLPFPVVQAASTHVSCSSCGVGRQREQGRLQRARRAISAMTQRLEPPARVLTPCNSTYWLPSGVLAATFRESHLPYSANCWFPIVTFSSEWKMAKTSGGDHIGLRIPSQCPCDEKPIKTRRGLLFFLHNLRVSRVGATCTFEHRATRPARRPPNDIASASPQMLIHQSYIMLRARTMRSAQQPQRWPDK